ncbi:hypothetical protein KKH23_09385, partial [Patescibacteria group bacterium]|nr:hypothetical protein [Patescibacteria group bacterium]
TVADEAITSAKLASGAVGGNRVWDGAIVSAHIGANVIGGIHILDGAIVSAKIGVGAVGGPLIQNLGILSGKLASGSIGATALLADAIVTSAKIGANVIATTHILNQGILSASIGALVVGTPHVTALAIVSGKVASGGLSPLSSGKIWAGFTGNFPREEDKPAATLYRDALVTDFQANPATGTFTFKPEWINDGIVNATDVAAIANAVDQYAEVDFGFPVWIKQYRQYGDTRNAGNGSWKIQYWDLSTRAWVDWQTGIATRTTKDWSGWVIVAYGTLVTDKIRLIVTALDTTYNQNYIRELEVKY